MTTEDVRSENKRTWDIGFKQGYYCAVANLKRMHDVGVEKELLECYGKVDLKDIEPYDAKTIKQIMKD